jgi:hypothetical protein
VILFSWVQ